MIYFLAEFCLNSLNGTFFTSAKELVVSTSPHARFAPLVSIYILVLGFNTLNTSVVLSQILFLYNLFHSVDTNFIEIVNKILSGINLTQKNIVIHFISNIPIIPICLSLILNNAYISDLNKCNSLLSRILYTMSSHLANLWLSDFILVKICEFAISFCVSSFFLKFYLKAQLKTSAVIFAFCGSYFLLKTYGLFPATTFSSGGPVIFSSAFNDFPSLESARALFLFIFIFGCSFFCQMLIRHLIMKYKHKNKVE